MKIEFIVPGPLMGYKQTTKKTMFHPKQRARSEAYGQFKKNVLLLSMEAGLPNMGIAKKERPPRLSIEFFWKGEPRIDFKNAYGAIEDGIWYQDDRYVIPGKFSDVHWDTGKEEARVTVELPDKKTGSGARGNADDTKGTQRAGKSISRSRGSSGEGTRTCEGGLRPSSGPSA